MTRFCSRRSILLATAGVAIAAGIGQGDRLQKIDTVGAAFGHLITARPTHLAENREAPLGVTDQGNIYSWINEVIASVKFGDFGGGLGQRQSCEVDRSKQRQTQISLAVEAGACPLIFFAKNFHSNLVVRSQNVTSRYADGIARWCEGSDHRRCRCGTLTRFRRCRALSESRRRQH